MLRFVRFTYVFVYSLQTLRPSRSHSHSHLDSHLSLDTASHPSSLGLGSSHAHATHHYMPSRSQSASEHAAGVTFRTCTKSHPRRTRTIDVQQLGGPVSAVRSSHPPPVVRVQSPVVSMLPPSTQVQTPRSSWYRQLGSRPQLPKLPIRMTRPGWRRRR